MLRFHSSNSIYSAAISDVNTLAYLYTACVCKQYDKKRPATVSDIVVNENYNEKWLQLAVWPRIKKFQTFVRREEKNAGPTQE